jgi:hypothetical protein
VSNNIQQAADKKQADTKTYRVCNNGRNVSGAMVSQQTGNASRQGQFTENNYATRFVLSRDRANVKAKGSKYAVLPPHPKHASLWRSAEEAATMK